MSNVLAGIGMRQLRVLADRVERNHEIFAFYKEKLADLAGVEFMPVPDWSYSTHWLTCITIDPDLAGVERDVVIVELEKNNIESLPTWKPMHL